MATGIGRLSEPKRRLHIPSRLLALCGPPANARLARRGRQERHPGREGQEVDVLPTLVLVLIAAVLIGSLVLAAP